MFNFESTISKIEIWQGMSMFSYCMLCWGKLCERRFEAAIPQTTVKLQSHTEQWNCNPIQNSETAIPYRTVNCNPNTKHTCIHHRIHLAVGDMTMSGWKPIISLIHPPTHPIQNSELNPIQNCKTAIPYRTVKLQSHTELLYCNPKAEKWNCNPIQNCETAIRNRTLKLQSHTEKWTGVPYRTVKLQFHTEYWTAIQYRKVKLQFHTEQWNCNPTQNCNPIQNSPEKKSKSHICFFLLLFFFFFFFGRRRDI